MPDEDSEIIINPRIYKAALEAAKVNGQLVSEFVEEAINNQIDVSDERKQLSLLEKELEVINRRTKIVREKAYERLSKLEDDLDSYKEKYRKAASKINEVNTENDNLEKDLRKEKDKLRKTEDKLKDFKNKYDDLLKDFKEKYHLLAQNIPLGIAIIQNKNTEFFNDYLYRMLGYDKGDIKDIFSILPKTSETLLKKKLSAKKNCEFDLEVKTMKSSKIPLKARLVKIQYDEKPAFALILKDIMKNVPKENTKKLKKLIDEKEDRIAQLNKMLKQKQTKGKKSKVPDELPALPKTIPKTTSSKVPSNALIILTDAEGNITSINNQVTSILGYTLQDFTDEEESKLTKLHEIIADTKERSIFPELIKEIELTRKPVIREVLLKDKQGRSRNFTVMMELILDIDSEPIGLINIFF